MNSLGLSFALAAGSGAIFGVAAIGCWALIVQSTITLAFTAARKNCRWTAALTSFVIGGFAAAAAIFSASRPQGLSLGETFRAGFDAETYGHVVEHAAEVSICLSSYAWVMGGALCAALVLAGFQVIGRRRAT